LTRGPLTNPGVNLLSLSFVKNSIASVPSIFLWACRGVERALMITSVKLILLSATAWALSLIAVCGQITNASGLVTVPATKLESFDTNVDVVIFKATTDLGTISADSGALTIRCRQIKDITTGTTELGLSIELNDRGPGRSVLLVDYDEIDSLLGALDYFRKLEPSATPLESFDAAITTRGGFRVATLGNRRTGKIQFGARDMRIGSAPIILTRQNLEQVASFLTQAKTTLDSLRQ